MGEVLLDAIKWFTQVMEVGLLFYGISRSLSSKNILRMSLCNNVEMLLSALMILKAKVSQKAHRFSLKLQSKST